MKVKSERHWFKGSFGFHFWSQWSAASKSSLYLRSGQFRKQEPNNQIHGPLHSYHQIFTARHSHHLTLFPGDPCKMQKELTSPFLTAGTRAELTTPPKAAAQGSCGSDSLLRPVPASKRVTRMDPGSTLSRKSSVSETGPCLPLPGHGKLDEGGCWAAFLVVSRVMMKRRYKTEG